ncbi:Beta-xylosidase [Collinsella aerofaciens]|uniref:Beta-xylosidase n=1 Tax=Collinsella aerofaciens TaxID=74426 RepID=A0A5K1J283_9ACTN|nr:family 43 glycosylhydrolase [Collinsella aerofaciens]VWL96428.1 Beta-xylosidase [Collinsella aerofaciens]
MTIKSLKDSTTHRSDDYASSPVVSTEPSYFANPVLPGFHPDPCLCRAGEDYYLVTSTFNWLPGVSLYHSRDLVLWESLGGILDKLDLRGIPESGGVWAPDLTHANGEFWLVYSVAKTLSGAFKDVDNYLVRARDIEGPWSEPVLLGAKGFDPCLVHAQDGCRLVLPQWDWRPLEGHYKFNGLLIYDLDVNTGKTGDPVRIFDHTGDTPCVCEGPHIMEHDGWFYLLAAEGGTGVNHRTVVARSRTVDGYYEPMPGNPLVSAARAVTATWSRGRTALGTPVISVLAACRGPRPVRSVASPRSSASSGSTDGRVWRAAATNRVPSYPRRWASWRER